MNNSISNQIVIVTPEHAERLLSRNTKNRKVSKNNLAKLKRSLLRGDWVLNGEAIKIAADGRVLDGQHRLMAVAETGISIETFLVTGLDGNIQHTMDSGKARNISDAFSLMGISSATAVAATVAGVIRAEQYGLRNAFQTSEKTPVATTEAVDRLEREPELADLSRATTKFGRIGLTGRIASVLYYTFSSVDADDADYFFEKLFEGDGLERGNPILTLRNLLISSKESYRGERNPVWLAAVTIKAWNKFRDGESAGLLRWIPGGVSAEKFPEVR